MREKYIKGYAFDIDDNLLHTDLKVFVEREVIKQTEKGTESVWVEEEIPDKELKSTIQKPGYRLPNGDREQAFRWLRAPGAMKQDLLNALNADKIGPSWKNFKKANINARPLWLITARGNQVYDLIESHQALLYEGLTAEEHDQFKENMNKHVGTKTKNLDKLIAKYLEMSYYAPCSNSEFAEKSNIPHTLSVPARKVLAFDNFVASLPEHPIYRKYIVSQIGFSDDSLENIYAMQEAMQTNFVQKYPDIMFTIYDTNNPLVVKRTSYINPNSKLHSDI